MNKNDYIRDLNKIKTTEQMKKRLLDISSDKEEDVFMRNSRYNRIIGLVAVVVLICTG